MRRFLPSALRLALLLLVVTGMGCAGAQSAEDTPDVQTRAELVESLRSLKYRLAPLSSGLFPMTPQPASAYEVTQRDGRVFNLLTFAPEDYDLLRNESARRASLPKLFRKGSVVLLAPVRSRGASGIVPFTSTDLHYDLVRLLGPPVNP